MDKKKIDRERKRQEQMRKQLWAARDQFYAKHNPLSASDAVIEQFLEETAHIDMEPETRLIFFTDYERFGWDGVSKIHRYVIDRNPDQTFEYVSWINEGLALMGDKDKDVEFRTQVAQDVEKLIQEASAKETEEWVAGYWADYYLQHPMRNDQDPIWLQQAAKWLELLKDADDYDYHQLCKLADVYREQGRLDEAACLYTEALSCNVPGCCETTRNVEERLAMCKPSNSMKSTG